MQSQVRFNRVPEKVPVKVWRLRCRARSGSTGTQEKVPEKVWEVLARSRFQQSPKNVPEKVAGGFGAEQGQVQQGSEEGSGEGLGGFGAEPGPGSTEFRESLVESQVTGFWRRF